MAGFRLTGGGGGCPPTATPPSGYENPFRFDDAGRLWLTDCFQGFQYFGAARHDLTESVAPTTDGAPVSTAPDVVSGSPVTAGSAQTRTITNTTNCTIGILLAHDIIADITAHTDNWLQLAVSERWNGDHHAQASIYTVHDPFGDHGGFLRTALHGSANPHDVGADAAGGSSLQLTPGQSATVGARLYIAYPVGAYVPGDRINSASAAVRIYGYVLG